MRSRGVVSAISLFTRKLEAALTFYGAEFVTESKTEDNRQLIETQEFVRTISSLLRS